MVCEAFADFCNTEKSYAFGTAIISKDGISRNVQLYKSMICDGDIDQYGCGRGSTLDYENNVRYEGTFVNGVLHGSGRIVCTQSNKELASGHFYNGMLCSGSIDASGSGVGRMICDDGELREGTFDHGQLVCGKYVNKYGQQLEGEFIAGALVKGTVTFENGSVYEIGVQ